MPKMLDAVFARHRGPYVLMVSRPFAAKSGFTHSEWLPGEVDAEDAEDEALALLTDPRDTISHVYIWSLREQQFVASV